jgi:hypothetical protein
MPWLAPVLALVAALYASVGHAGASGYLAVMALAGVPSDTMKPTALVLNLVVASIGTWNFWRAGLVDVRAVGAFAVGSVPMAVVGGAWALSSGAYRIALGAVLLLSAGRLVLDLARAAPVGGGTAPHPAVSVAVGAAIGLLAGLTGTGGGIFLSPLLVHLGWADARRAGGTTAPFILVNSLAGLAGNVAVVRALPAELPWYVIAVALGGGIGSALGASRLPERVMRGLLAAVLLFAAGKLVLT